MKQYNGQIVSWDINDVIPYARNAREHSEDQITKLAASIAEFGFDQPIVVDSCGVIIKGHGRLLACKKLKLSRVPVLVREDLSEAAVKAARLADNRIALDSTWDNDLLKVEFEEIAELDFDAALTGFDALEIERLMGEVVEKFSHEEEWQGMPEFDHEDKTAFQSIHIHFKCQEDVVLFSELISQPITPKTRTIWYPEAEIERYADKEYGDGSADES